MTFKNQLPRFTFKECLKLCLPALIIGALVRLCFLIAVPEAYFGADSNSYFSTAEYLWLEGDFTLPAKRRYLYPLFLIPTPAFPFSNALQGIAVAQHLLGLCTIVAIGWIVGQLVQRPKLWVVPATIVVALWPRMLWYEHEVLAESSLLFAYAVAVALAFPFGALRDRKRLFWFLLTACTIIALKPHGKPLWLGLMAVAILTTTPYIWRWGWKCLAVLAVSGFVFFRAGSQSQGAWLLLSSSLPFVQVEGEKWATYRGILKPIVEESRADLQNYAFNQKHYKKALNSTSADGPLGAEWAALSLDRNKFTTVATSLSREGILHNPVAHARLVIQKILVASAQNKDNLFNPDVFWKKQESRNGLRWERELQGERPLLQLLYEVDYDGYRTLVAERTERSFLFSEFYRSFGSTLTWSNVKKGLPGEAPSLSLTLLGWLAVLGFVSCVFSRSLLQSAVLWFPPAIYLFLIFTVGDSVSRYLHPVDWAGITLAVIVLDRILHFIIQICGKNRTLTSPVAAPAQASKEPSIV